MEPCGIGKAVFLAPLRFIRWIWAPIKQAIKAGKLTIGVAEFAAFCTGSWGLSALEAYLWNCSEPFHEISLADNEITVEAGYVHLDFLSWFVLFYTFLAYAHQFTHIVRWPGQCRGWQCWVLWIWWIDMIAFCKLSCVYSMELQCLSGGLLVIEMPLQSSILSTKVQLGFNCLASSPGPLLESGGQGVMTLWLHFILASGAEFDILDHIFDFMRCQFQISYHLTFIISYITIMCIISLSL